MKKIIFLLLISISGFSQGFLTTPTTLVNQIPSIIVPNGTSFGSINFSDYGLTSVNGNTSGVISSCSITWQAGNYNGSVNGTYTIYGYTNCYSTPPISMIVNVVTLDTDYQAVLTKGTALGAVLPTPIIQGAGSNLITDLKANGTWTTKDVIYVPMTDGDAVFATINWKAPASNQLVAHGTTTFTVKAGIKGDGINGYYDDQHNLSTATNYTLNDAGAGIYAYDNTFVFAGCVATGARLTFQPSTTLSTNPGTRSIGVEMNGNNNPAVTDSYSAGYYHLYKQASGTINLAKNGGNVFTGLGSNSVARPNANVYLCARNNAGTADAFRTGTISYFWVGASNAANATQIYNDHKAWQKYLLTIRSKPTFGATAAIGTLINDTFARAALGSSYTTNGVATWTCDGTRLTQTGGTVAVNTNYMVYNYGHSSEKSEIDVTVKLISTPSGTTGGTAIGYHDFASTNGERSIFGKIDLTTGTDAGKASINLFDGTTKTQVQIGSAIPALAANDQFTMVITKSITSNLVTYVFTVTRVSDSASSTCTYSNILGDSTGDFAMWNFGGTIQVTQFKPIINDEKNHLGCFIGDSVCHGYDASDLAHRWASLILSDYQVSAGAGDLTSDVFGNTITTVAGKMQNLIDLNAKYYFLAIGGNDVAAGGGVITAQMQANLIALANTLKNEGYKVVFVTPSPRSVNLTVMTTFTRTYFPNDPTISAGWTATQSGGSLNPAYDSVLGDGVHMNDTGMSVFAAAIVSNLITFFY